MEEVYLCPFCKTVTGTTDKSGHLYVNKHKGVYNCRRCGVSGKASTLNTTLLSKTHSSMLDINYNIEQEPGELISNNPSYSMRYVKKYLQERGVSSYEIYKYRIRYDIYRDAILFPIYGIPGGTPLWYQRRYMNGKYIFPANTPATRYTMFRTFGIPIIGVMRPHVLAITEGIFDAIAIGKCMPAVAVFGKNCTVNRLNSIKYLTTGKAVVILDSDARKEAQEMVFKLHRVGVNARCLDIPIQYKDPGEMNKFAVDDMLKSYGVYDG